MEPGLDIDLEFKDLKYSLFFKRRFLPIFLATFLGAFNDNLLRNGLVVMIAYASLQDVHLPVEQPAVLVTLCSALLVIPFMLFSSIAGPLADKYEKHRLVVYTKVAEVAIMLVAAYGFSTHNIYLLMAMLFVSGTHSTFYGPIKLSILPDHLKPGELLAANGFMSGGTYLAILAGLICGGQLVTLPGNVIGVTAVVLALIGLAASLFIPHSRPAAPDMRISMNIITGSLHIIEYALKSRKTFHAILGLSWFLLVGSVFMAQFANYAKEVMHADDDVYTLFLTVFSIGIAMGSVLCDRLLKGESSGRFAPFAAVSMSLFTYLMIINTPYPVHEGLMGVREFLADRQHWTVLLCMLMVAVCGGVFMVPLYAILQSDSESRYRSRVIAASNLSDSFFMTVAAILSVLLLKLGVSIVGLFYLVATLNLAVACYARKITS